MPAVIVVDSGTTNTRVRLWSGERVVATASETVGARNTAIDGHNGQVRGALKRLVAHVTEQVGIVPEALICSGMITANVGLYEVPHVQAPAGPGELARQVVRHDFAEICDLPVYFIPGIKSVPTALSAETLGEADILRGEEAEAVGLRELLGLRGPLMLMHYGSHHKAIAVDEDGRILYSRTSMTGELLQVIAQQTVLKGSLASLDGVEPDQAMWRIGLEQALRGGVGRALFLTRVADQIWQRSKAEATSFLLGVLTSLDLPLLVGARESGATVLLYGKGHFPPIMKTFLDQQGWPDVLLVDPGVADLCSAVGAVRIYEQMHRDA